MAAATKSKTAVPDVPVEVRAAERGESPTAPFTPQVAVPEPVFSDEGRKLIQTAFDAIVKAEEKANENQEYGAVVALRDVRRTLAVYAGVDVAPVKDDDAKD